MSSLPEHYLSLIKYIALHSVARASHPENVTFLWLLPPCPINYQVPNYVLDTLSLIPLSFHRAIHNRCSSGLLQWLPNISCIHFFKNLLQQSIIHIAAYLFIGPPWKKTFSIIPHLDLHSGVSLGTSVGIMHVVLGLKPCTSCINSFSDLHSGLWTGLISSHIKNSREDFILIVSLILYSSSGSKLKCLYIRASSKKKKNPPQCSFFHSTSTF